MNPNAAEREPLDHDLHAEVGHVPPRVLDDVVEQQPQVGVDRVVARQLLVEVPGEHLDVAGLVHHLRRRVVLGVDPRHRLDDLRGADERALLAVEELRQRPVLRLDAEARATPSSPHFSNGVPFSVELAAERHVVGQRWFCEHDLLLVDVGVPGEVGLCVPLRRLRLLVELAQRGTTPLVVPREDGVPVRLDGCSTSSTSVLVTARIASRSSTSSRPRISFVLAMGGTPYVTVSVPRRPGNTSSRTRARAAAASVRSIGRVGERA